jgi:cytochrome P450
VSRVVELYERFAALIERRRAEEPARDALSILCHTVDEDGDFLTTPEIAGELHGLFVGGFETTAMTMTWALLALAGSPDVKVVDETLDAVVKESQRLLPTVPVTLPRRAVQDVEIDGVLVPEGALMYASPMLEHLNPEVFPDPHVFRPSRWTGLNPSPSRFLPYGLGMRRCLGAAFADLQVRTILGLALERGTPELVTSHVDYGIRTLVISYPKKPVIVRFVRGAARYTPVTGSVRKLWAA